MRRRNLSIKQQRTRPRPSPRTSAQATGLACPSHLGTRLGCKTRQRNPPPTRSPRTSQQTANRKRRTENQSAAPITDVQKNNFGGIEKLAVPYKIYPLKATYNPYIKVANGRTTVDSKTKNEFHFPENRENQTKLLSRSHSQRRPSTLRLRS